MCGYDNVTSILFIERKHDYKVVNFNFLFVASLLKLYRQTERDGSVSVWDREKYRLASSQGLTHFAVKELTSDHHPDREDERTRVEAAGGQVLNWGGLPRVNGQLAITRAIGDVFFKR